LHFYFAILWQIASSIFQKGLQAAIGAPVASNCHYKPASCVSETGWLFHILDFAPGFFQWNPILWEMSKSFKNGGFSWHPMVEDFHWDSG